MKNYMVLILFSFLGLHAENMSNAPMNDTENDIISNDMSNDFQEKDEVPVKITKKIDLQSIIHKKQILSNNLQVLLQNYFLVLASNKNKKRSDVNKIDDDLKEQVFEKATSLISLLINYISAMKNINAAEYNKLVPTVVGYSLNPRGYDDYNIRYRSLVNDLTKMFKQQIIAVMQQVFFTEV